MDAYTGVKNSAFYTGLFSVKYAALVWSSRKDEYDQLERWYYQWEVNRASEKVFECMLAEEKERQKT